MNNNLTNKLLRIKEQIEKAKIDRAQLEGRLQSFHEQLKNNFGCASIDQAEKKIELLGKELNLKKTELKTGVEGLENNYEW